MSGAANFKLSKTDKIIIFLVIFPIPLAVALYVGYIGVFGPSYYDITLKTDSLTTYFGKVDSLYFDKENHNVKKAVSRAGKEFIIERVWEPYIHLGDSIAKRRGSFIVEIYHPYDSVLILDYKQLRNNYIKDHN